MKQTNNKLQVDIAPDFEIYRIYQENEKPVEIILAEFVDNSMQSFRDWGDKLKVPRKEIRLDILESGEKMIIADNAGGITRSKFLKAMKVGLRRKDWQAGSSLSVYGVGLKLAAMWFSNKWTLETANLQEKKAIFLKVDLDKLTRENQQNLLYSDYKEKEADKEHYTKITIFNCLRKNQLTKKYCEEILLPYLLETFQRFRDVKIILKFEGIEIQPIIRKIFLPAKELKSLINEGTYKNKEKLLANHVCCLASLSSSKFNTKGHSEGTENITWEKAINIKLPDGKSAKGQISLLKKGAAAQPGIRLFRNNRVIIGTSVHANIVPIIHKYAKKKVSCR